MAALEPVLDSKKHIIIKNARVNNLKNLSVAIPRHQLVVITGLSGSGKSSLAFDTLFAEGQRKYVESLSSYARQFLGRMEKPDVDDIQGVAPAIAIEQKVNTRNPRSTVGTTTEIYDYLKLLFARIGATYSPVSGNIVKSDSVTDVVDFIHQNLQNQRIIITSPLIISEGRSIEKEMELLLSKGFTRLFINGVVIQIEEYHPINSETIEVLIDRLQVEDSEEMVFRLSDSVQTAFFEGHGACFVYQGQIKHAFSDRFEADGMQFEKPTVNLFAFNNPYGACKKCEGFGRIIGIDPELVIPDKKKSVYEGAIAPWRGEHAQEWLTPLLKNGIHFDFPIHRAIQDLTEAEYQLLWEGNNYFQGLNQYFENLERQTYKIQYRVILSRFRGKTDCPECKGTRLRKDAGFVKLGGKSIMDLVLMPISELSSFTKNLSLSPHDHAVADRILKEINNRLAYLEKVGLGYLTLNRLTGTLSGGEYQRIKLATSLGSALVGSMYILDEPSIGLHPRDTQRLVEVLLQLQQLGNTVIVVEHEEAVMKAAHQIIDIGPEAGTGGGNLVFQGNWAEMNPEIPSYTVKYLTGNLKIEIPSRRRKWIQSILFSGARENNLKNIQVEIPLGVLTMITGVSGSGKSTLIKKIVYPAVARATQKIVGEAIGKFDEVGGHINRIKQVEFVDQNPIGKSSRSNPITYIKAYDVIRNLFAEQPLSVQRGYQPSYFSFNVSGGRCETCQGEGVVTVEMQFMADIHLTCESCKGKRFQSEILEVTYKEKNIAEILALTVDDALVFFAGHKALQNRLKPLHDVGLGYITLGQSSSSLSGGEAQRVKLASFLSGGVAEDPILFIFDEPTTGLHFHDIHKLLFAMNALVDKGHTVVVIEHNMDMVKCADWIIDLGPEGGKNGGMVCFSGTPEDMILLENNHTAIYLKEKMV